MKAWILLCCVALLTVAVEPAFAAQSQVLMETCRFLARLTRWLIGVGYVCGCIGFVLVSIKASATGKFGGGPFLAIMGGMFMLATIPRIVSLLIDGSFSISCA